MNKPLVSIIILSYNSAKYIGGCLESALSQTYANFEILVVINGNNDGSAEYIKERFRRYKKIQVFEPKENLWFSRGNNFGIKNAKGEYILCLNQDTILEPNYLSLLVSEMENNPALGSVTGKLLHYKYDIRSKTRILDSTGIEIFRTRRVIDRGQWEEDRFQYDDEKMIFGASGAAAMYRRSALEDVKLPKRDGGDEYFDEDFVAYKEDVDIAWRLQLFGYGCKYVPRAVVYHGRSVGRAWPTQFIRFVLNRRRQSRMVRQLSFKNHYLMMVKNEQPSAFWRHFAFIALREILLLFYTLLFEQFQIMAIRQFFQQLPEARRKRQIILNRSKINIKDYVKLFH